MTKTTSLSIQSYFPYVCPVFEFAEFKEQQNMVLSSGSLNQQGIYVLDAGNAIYVYLGM